MAEPVEPIGRGGRLRAKDGIAGAFGGVRPARSARSIEHEAL